MHLLLVEDDEALALGIEFSLKKEGFRLDRVATVKDAKYKYEKNNYDLILLDISLPDGNGYEVCEYIRNKSEVPIIFLTALDNEVNIIQGLEIGGDDYITKPFGVRELIARIKVILKRVDKKYNVGILRSGEIEVDTKTGKVTKDNNELFLTAQEYRLLLIFMNNYNIIIERESLIDKLIEGAGEYLDSNTLSVYIKRMRDKIESNVSIPEYIVTTRGVGYRWNKKVYKE
ncbi:response regulator transcription factor [Clostridium sp.]|uniref:response regulator transcription factor n=1 Tax=Clostridium sp. TaxID=1506 RepID=UPI002FCB5668